MVTAQQMAINITRMMPSVDLPDYTFIPGSGTPHPVRDPQGHSYGQKRTSPKSLTDENWRDNRAFLMGIDYFNMGYYWEAQDEWERLIKSSGSDSVIGRFLKGLVKMAAAGVKVREGSIHGVRRHAASAGEVFADVAAEVDRDFFCGLEFTALQFAADRAAQLAYKHDIDPGVPMRVFPFAFQPQLRAT